MKAGNVTYLSPDDIPDIVPVFPLTGALLLPGGQMPLNIFEPRYLSMIDDALMGERLIGMIQPCLKQGMLEEGVPALCHTGCLGRITAFQEAGDGRYLISLSGVCRYTIDEELNNNKPYRQCRVRAFEEELKSTPCANEIDRDALLSAFQKYLEANDMDADWETVDSTDDETLVTALCMMSPYGPAEKQALLEAPNLKSRAETLIAISEIHLARSGDDNNNRLQ